jgi:hypothetical protein
VLRIVVFGMVTAGIGVIVLVDGMTIDGWIYTCLYDHNVRNINYMNNYTDLFLIHN